MKASKTLAKIDATIEAGQEKEYRSHIGASILARPCMRQVWYIWRWAALEPLPARVLRLLERGQREEEIFFKYLQGIGCEIWPKDPATGEQWRVSFANGHGGGSCDGVARGIPDLPPGTPFLVECKTHKKESFAALEKEGLCGSKPEHFGQTQIYTVKMQLPYALYMAVNKNDDNLHLEIIQPNPQFVATLIDRAERLVSAETPPQRINKSPSYYICKMCMFRDICHTGKVKPLANCRTCRFSKPIDNGKWECTRYDLILSKEQQIAGCLEYRLKAGFLE